MPLDVPGAQPTFIAGHDRPPPFRRWGVIAAGAAAAVLGGLAVAVQLRALQAEKRYPPEGRFITADGVRLHYVEHGSGRPVVLLHGMCSMLQDFTSSIVDELARGYRVIAFDRPGYGYSERPRRIFWTPRRQARLIHMAVTRLGVEKPILVGHSWGALVALAYALAYPHQTAAIVLLGGYVFPVRRPDLALSGLFRMPLLGVLLRHTLAPLAVRLMAPRLLHDVVFAPNPVPARFAHEFPLAFNERPAQLRAIAEEALMLRFAAAALSRRYREVTVPTVILAGESDHVVDPHRQAIPLHHVIAHSTVRIMPRTGHMVHQTHPQAVYDAIETARQQVETAS